MCCERAYALAVYPSRETERGALRQPASVTPKRSRKAVGETFCFVKGGTDSQRKNELSLMLLGCGARGTSMLASVYTYSFILFSGCSVIFPRQHLQ